MDLSRQSSIVNGPIPRILLIGAGATGFHVAHALIGAGCPQLEIWDYDVVEGSNLNRQLYGVENIGEYKVDALAHLLNRIRPGGEEQIIVSRNEEMDPFGVEKEYLRRFPVIINTADNLYFHGLLWKKIQTTFDNQYSPPLFYISPRMSSFDMEVQTFVLGEDNPWQMFLTKEEWMEVEKERSGCTSGSTTFSPSVVTTSMVLAGFTVQEVFNRMNGEPTHQWFRMDIESGKIEMNEVR